MTPDKLAAILRELIRTLEAHAAVMREYQATMQRVADALDREAPRDTYSD